ncbi:uncharacterized protein METZ01_LOCUS398196, partial [marine metagenome]
MNLGYASAVPWHLGKQCRFSIGSVLARSPVDRRLQRSASSAPLLKRPKSESRRQTAPI